MTIDDELRTLAETLTLQARLPAEGKPVTEWTQDENRAVLESMAAEIRDGLYTWADLVREVDREITDAEA